MMLRPKEVVCKWVDAFNDHDVDAIVRLYHDNATNHQVTNDPVIGIEAIREMFTAEFSTADMTAIVENIFEDGQWAILEWKDPLGLRGCGCQHRGLGGGYGAEAGLCSRDPHQGPEYQRR